ncbi:MAG: tagaturonate reductase [Herbinix sp.]|jgi:tagaturonate reductase|nr:tagaturonate reductase [Herbinix sp.]
METINNKTVNKVTRPVKVIQFGEGNFLRGFVDYMLDIANEKDCFNGDIVLVKPIEYGSLDGFHQQNYLYTVSLRGLVDGAAQVSNRIVTSIADALDPYVEYTRYAELAKLTTLRFVVSNTTEAGIVYDETDRFDLCPPMTYPGKLTKFLYERYLHFNGDFSKGLIILPVELIDDNGIHLKENVLKLTKLWGLEEGFTIWLSGACVFCSTLVDRIVTGYPKEEAEELWKDYGYTDHLIVTGEPFALWVIESEREIEEELPLRKAGLPVIFTDNQKPYKQRKVRILNGAHTSFVLASYLAGNDFVLESMQDELINHFMTKTIYDEIIPTLKLPKEDLISFAEAVKIRFQNPYIKHALLSISLNSVSKWKARCMPSLIEYMEKFSAVPKYLAFSVAALMEFYKGTELVEGALIGHRGEITYKIMDDKEVLEFFVENSDREIPQFVVNFLSNKSFWDQDLTELSGLADAVTEYLMDIRSLGMREALKKLD